MCSDFAFWVTHFYIRCYRNLPLLIWNFCDCYFVIYDFVFWYINTLQFVSSMRNGNDIEWCPQISIVVCDTKRKRKCLKIKPLWLCFSSSMFLQSTNPFLKMNFYPENDALNIHSQLQCAPNQSLNRSSYERPRAPCTVPFLSMLVYNRCLYAWRRPGAVFTSDICLKSFWKHQNSK